MRDDYLDVAFGSKGATLDQGFRVLDAPGIDVESSLHVIKSVGDDTHLREEEIRVDVLSSWVHLIESGRKFEFWIHEESSRCSSH